MLSARDDMEEKCGNAAQFQEQPSYVYRLWVVTNLVHTVMIGISSSIPKAQASKYRFPSTQTRQN
jgi:hypothetical protein